MSDSIDWSLDCALERDARRLDETRSHADDPEVESLVQADREGAHAARSGVRLHACPYLPGCAENVYWRRAWMRAASVPLARKLEEEA